MIGSLVWLATSPLMGAKLMVWLPIPDPATRISRQRACPDSRLPEARRIVGFVFRIAVSPIVTIMCQ